MTIIGNESCSYTKALVPLRRFLQRKRAFYVFRHFLNEYRRNGFLKMQLHSYIA